jgi:hypothetical protein
MTSFSGTGYILYISLLKKEEVYELNNFISLNKYKYSDFFKKYKERETYVLYGFDFNKFFILDDDFSEKHINFSENFINIFFEKELFYFITIEEIKGDIFSLEEIEQNLVLNGISLSLDDFYIDVVTNILYKPSLKKGVTTFIDKYQWLVYHKVGVQKNLRLI